jgi:hypothetical protein
MIFIPAKVHKERMDRCSYFIEGKALFGSFPSQNDVNSLENEGARYFIDLTDADEKQTTPYVTKFKYIKYPIPDRNIPENWKSFAQLIIEICKVIKTLERGELVYVHCKGGHGRSGVMVACILCYYYGISAGEALKQTNIFHQRRPVMREKWRRLGSPQGKRQKDFVYKFFRCLRYDKENSSYFANVLSNNSPYPVTIAGVGTFANAQDAYDSLIGDEKNGEKRKNIMTTVLDHKFSQHLLLKETLMNTGLRTLLCCSPDLFWGGDQNNHGKILTILRERYLHKDFCN